MTATISREELQAEIDRGGVVLLEALPPEHYEKEHLPGARNLPLDRIDDLAPVLIPSSDAAAVTYCSSTACNNSAIAADRLGQLGYTNVRKYVEGKQGWLDAGLPFEHGPDGASAAA